MKTRIVLVLVTLLGVFLGQEAQAYYNPSAGRWLSRDPIFDSAAAGTLDRRTSLVTVVSEDSADTFSPQKTTESNLYYFVSNDPVSRVDAFGLWELRCRLLSGIGGVTGQRHCWVECGGHSYSLLNNSGVATPVIDDPRDKGKGDVVAQGPGKCKCLAWQFKWNRDTYPYDKDQCNSNFRANSLLKCCGISVTRPSRAYGWGDCDNGNYMISCACYSGIVN